MDSPDDERKIKKSTAERTRRGLKGGVQKEKRKLSAFVLYHNYR